MNPKLLTNIKIIESLGNKFNDAMAREEELAEVYELDAYKTILDYIFSEDLKLGDYDWAKIKSDYEEEGLLEVLDILHEIHNNVNRLYLENDDSFPLEIFVLFHTYNTSFHYPNYSIPKKVLYVDMDNVIVDFPSAFEHYSQSFLEAHPAKDEIEGIFAKMKPMKDAVQSLEHLYKYFDLYILSTSPFGNSSAWRDKLEWVKQYLPIVGYKRLILSHHKNLNQGDYLIDDRTRNGVLHFKGEHIHFGTEKFPDWKAVTEYLISKEK